MKNKEIYDKWTSFINDPKYEQYLLSNEDIWLNNLKYLKNYITPTEEKYETKKVPINAIYLYR